MNFETLIRTMTAAACRGDGKGVADCFTRDGTYHDVFYGAFNGTDIADMIENYFHRDAQNFRWDVYDPISDGETGYARYVFSFDSKLDGHEGNRACFEGVAICALKDGLIQEYHEVAETVTGLSMLGFADGRIAGYAAKKGRALMDRNEAELHRAGKN